MYPQHKGPFYLTYFGGIFSKNAPTLREKYAHASHSLDWNQSATKKLNILKSLSWKLFEKICKSLEMMSVQSWCILYGTPGIIWSTNRKVPGVIHVWPQISGITFSVRLSARWLAKFPRLSVFSVHGPLTSRKESEKTNEPILRKTPDGQTDWQELKLFRTHQPLWGGSNKQTNRLTTTTA